MRKQIYNLNCRKQTSGVQGQCPWRGPRGSAPGEVQGAAPLAVVPLTGQRAGVKGTVPLAGDRGRSPRNKNKLLTS